MTYILDKGETRVILCDLESGKVLAKRKTSAKLFPLALNDAGSEILMRREDCARSAGNLGGRPIGPHQGPRMDPTRRPKRRRAEYQMGQVHQR